MIYPFTKQPTSLTLSPLMSDNMRTYEHKKHHSQGYTYCHVNYDEVFYKNC